MIIDELRQEISGARGPLQPTSRNHGKAVAKTSTFRKRALFQDAGSAKPGKNAKAGKRATNKIEAPEERRVSAVVDPDWNPAGSDADDDTEELSRLKKKMSKSRKQAPSSTQSFAVYIENAGLHLI